MGHMKTRFVRIFLVIFLAAAVFFITRPMAVKPTVVTNTSFIPQITAQKPSSAALSAPENAVQPGGAQAEIDQAEQDFIAKIHEMHAFIRVVTASEDAQYTETPEERAAFEDLIAKVEQETRQQFTGDIGAFRLDPVEHKTYYQLEQKFGALDEQMRRIIGEL